jgi:hypothetical protein
MNIHIQCTYTCRKKKKVIIQPSRCCLYTVIWLQNHNPATRIMSILSFDDRSHNPATQIMFLYCHRTAEVVIQLPGSCLYTVIWWQKSSSSYPDHVSILSFDDRSHNPATRIMSIQSYDRRSHYPATRIMGVLYNMTAEVLNQLPG